MKFELSSAAKVSGLSRPAAGTIAGLCAGVAYLVAQVTLTGLLREGGATEPIARIAAILMGPDTAPPDGDFSFTVLGMGMIIHLGLSIVFGQLVSALVWRRPPRLALLVGAATGIALYALNFELLAPLAFPWFERSITYVSILDHALFGAVAAAVCVALRAEAPGAGRPAG